MCALKYKIPIIAAGLLGALHFAIVGIPFIQARGGGEGLMYILWVDFPLDWVASTLAPKLYYNSVTFNFWLFPVLGTILYAAVGYLIGLLAVLVKKRKIRNV
jgi:tetrahydromethanopterin S-methyltransferase subunit C